MAHLRWTSFSSASFCPPSVASCAPKPPNCGYPGLAPRPALLKPAALPPSSIAIPLDKEPKNTRMPSSSPPNFAFPLPLVRLALVGLLGLVALSAGCGLPPAPPPPPPMCCPCAPPAPPPPVCCPCAPPPPPPSPCGGGCARRRLYSSAMLRKYWRSKRQAQNETTAAGKLLLGPEQPPAVYRDGQIPCPKAEWAPHMRQAMIEDDAYASVHSIQAVLLREVSTADEEKFLVTCGRPEALGGGDSVLPAAVELSSLGDAFCNVRGQERTLWCQAVAVSA